MGEKRYQRGGLDEGLSEYLGIKGQLNSEIESTIRPTILMRDLSDTPFARDAVSVAESATVAAVVGEFGYAMCVAGQGQVLQLQQIVVTSQDAAPALQGVVFTLLTGIERNLIGATSTVRFQQLANAPFQAPGWAARPSLIEIGTDAVLRGEGVLVLQVPALASVIITLPRAGIQLSGANELSSNTRSAFAVRSAGAQQAFIASFVGLEWPLPG